MLHSAIALVCLFLKYEIACISIIYPLLLRVACNQQFTESGNDCKQTVTKFAKHKIEFTLSIFLKHLWDLCLLFQDCLKIFLPRLAKKQSNHLKYAAEVLD